MTQKANVGIIPRMKDRADFELFKARVQQLMDEQGMNPRSLSLEAGLNETFVRDMFQKERTPGIQNASAIAAALGTTIVDLLRRKGDMPAQDVFDELSPEDRREAMQYLRFKLRSDHKNGTPS